MEINRVLFIGSKKQGLECVKKMYEIAPDKLVGAITIDDRNDNRSEFKAIRRFAKENEIKFLIVDKDDFELAIKIFSPDLCIVSGWYWIFSKDILRSVPHGFIGFHNSLLPRYKGGAPLVWQIINGETSAGVSMFSLTEEMDAGEVWAQREFPIGEHETIEDVTNRASRIALDLLDENYCNILKGKVKPRPQEGITSKYPIRTPDDGLIDFTKPAKDVYNFIRAQTHPYPGAFFKISCREIIIWKASLDDNEGLHMICGDGKPIYLIDIQER